jgi:hypothetical protein
MGCVTSKQVEDDRIVEPDLRGASGKVKSACRLSELGMHRAKEPACSHEISEREGLFSAAAGSNKAETTRARRLSYSIEAKAVSSSLLDYTTAVNMCACCQTCCYCCLNVGLTRSATPCVLQRQQQLQQPPAVAVITGNGKGADGAVDIKSGSGSTRGRRLSYVTNDVSPMQPEQLRHSKHSASAATAVQRYGSSLQELCATNAIACTSCFALLMTVLVGIACNRRCNDTFNSHCLHITIRLAAAA